MLYPAELLGHMHICRIQLHSLGCPAANCLHIVQCFAVLVKLSRRSERQTGAFCLSVLYRMQREAEAKEHTPELSAFLQKLVRFFVRKCGKRPELL